jgi:hypothetical protein
VNFDLGRAKVGFSRLFPVGHPAREAILAQPESLTEEEFVHLYPVLIRLAGIRENRQ